MLTLKLSALQKTSNRSGFVSLVHGAACVGLLRFYVAW